MGHFFRMMIRFLGMMVVMMTGTMAGSLEEMKAEVHEKEGKSLPFRWTKVGESEEPALVLFLHGAGERGSDNKAQLKHGVADLLKWISANDESAVVLAPQCEPGVWWADLRGDGRSAKGGDLAKEPSAMMRLGFEVMDRLVREQKVDRSRIYVTGLSMGGFGCFAAVARRPDGFAAAIPVCGGGDPKTAAQMKGVPFRVFHGEVDEVVPLQASRVMVEALEEVKADVKLKIYAGVGHDSWTATYEDAAVWKWLFSQKKE